MRRERQLLGPSGTRRLDSLISGLTLQQRRALHESIKRRLNEADAGGEEEEESPIKDETAISRNGIIVFERAQDGWVTRVTITSDQILSLVKPGFVKSTAARLKRSQRGDVVSIPKTAVIDGGIINNPTNSSLDFQKISGDTYRDNAVISEEEMIEIFNQGGYQKGAPAGQVETPDMGDVTPALDVGSIRYNIGRSNFDIIESSGTVSIYIPGGSIEGFYDIFGNSERVRSSVADQINNRVIKLYAKDAIDNSVMQLLASEKNVIFFNVREPLSFERKVTDGTTFYLFTKSGVDSSVISQIKIILDRKGYKKTAVTAEEIAAVTAKDGAEGVNASELQPGTTSASSSNDVFDTSDESVSALEARIRKKEEEHTTLVNSADSVRIKESANAIAREISELAGKKYFRALDSDDMTKQGKINALDEVLSLLNGAISKYTQYGLDEKIIAGIQESITRVVIKRNEIVR